MQIGNSLVGERERERDRERDRQTDRQTDRNRVCITDIDRHFDDGWLLADSSVRINE